MTRENGRMRHLDATLSVSERAAALEQLNRLAAATAHMTTGFFSTRHDARDGPTV